MELVALGGDHRIAGGRGELILVSEEQGAPGLQVVTSAVTLRLGCDLGLTPDRGGH